MIIFRKIKYRNFLSTGNTFTEIPLDKAHTTLIVGDSGSGKSTITDAISFALYGKSFRPINKNQVVNTINNKECLVEIEFESFGKKYKVVRGLKPNVFEIYCDDELINQDSSVNDYQDYLEQQVLGMPFNVFTHVVVLGSVNFTPFMQLKSQDRRELVEDLLDIQIFSRMSALLKDMVSNNKTSGIELAAEINTQKEKIRIYEKYLDELKQDKQKQIEDNKAKITELDGTISSHTIELNKIQEQINQLTEQVKDEKKIVTKLQKYRDYQKNIKESIGKLKQELQFYEKNKFCPTCQRAFDSDTMENLVEKRTVDLEVAKASRNEMVARQLGYVKVISNFDAVKEQAQEYRDSKRDIQSAINESLRQIKYYISNKECPTCKRDFDANYVEQMTKESKDKVAALQEEMSKLELKIKDNDAKNAELQSITAELNQLEKDISTNKESIKNIEKDLKYYELNKECPTCHREFNSTSNKSKIEEWNEKIVKLKEGDAKIIPLIEEATEQSIQIQKVLTDIGKLRHSVSEREVKILSCSDYKNKLEKDIETLIKKQSKNIEQKNELDELTSKFKCLEKNKEDNLKTKMILELAAGILKDGGVKAKIVKQYLPVINKLVNRFLNCMNFFVSFSIDENFDETIKNRGRDHFTYNSLSEGERQRLDIAILLTWRTIATMKNSIRTNLLFIDELLDSSLDPAATENVMELIKSEPILKDNNIFVISHKTNLVDKFSDVLKFEKRNNFSQIIL